MCHLFDRNNPLFDAFVIELKDSAQEIDAIVWILQMTLNKDYGGSSAGYQLVNMIRTKVMETLSHTGKVKNVRVSYLLISPERGRWKLPKKGW